MMTQIVNYLYIVIEITIKLVMKFDSRQLLRQLLECECVSLEHISDMGSDVAIKYKLAPFARLDFLK